MLFYSHYVIILLSVCNLLQKPRATPNFLKLLRCPSDVEHQLSILSEVFFFFLKINKLMPKVPLARGFAYLSMV